MDTMQALLSRRSIRQYTDEPISESMREQLLRAAMQAPSANNEQPWHFIIVDERTLLDKLSEIHPYAKMLKQATLAILVCGDSTLEKSPGYWVVDCSAATENILLAAHALGLGAVWLGVYPREERMADMIRVFNLPDNIRPLSLISIGHPADTKAPADRYNPDRIRHNAW